MSDPGQHKNLSIDRRPDLSEAMRFYWRTVLAFRALWDDAQRRKFLESTAQIALDAVTDRFTRAKLQAFILAEKGKLGPPP